MRSRLRRLHRFEPGSGDCSIIDTLQLAFNSLGDLGKPLGMGIHLVEPPAAHLTRAMSTERLGAARLFLKPRPPRETSATHLFVEAPPP